MSNIFDYLEWRGDLSLKVDKFNEIDNLILSRLSYFPFDGLFENNEEIELKEVYKKYKRFGTTGRILQKEDIDLFPLLAQSNRFGNLKLTRFTNKLDLIKEKQFSATTILLPDEMLYISYRGTDNTVVGWKEDFNMSFSELVPSQTDAVEYLENVAKVYNKKLLVGGHSKGGNLAVYAGTFCKKEIQDKIIKIYNNDGPGFMDKVVESEEYKAVLNKVHTYIPQTSIIGRLLNHKEETTILKSTQTGIMQHDLYTWQLIGTHFIEDELTNSSEFIDNTITKWLREVEPEQRERFIDIFFEILNTTQIETLSEFNNNKFTNAITMLKTYKNIDDNSKEIMIKTLKAFLGIARNNIIIGRPKIKNLNK